jgi:choline dehydrogenase-like flavoprotein
MGASPPDSVVDADHKVSGTPNLYACDGSVCPTPGSANPALTKPVGDKDSLEVMALASRLADRLSG